MVTTVREPRAYEIMAIFLPELADEDLTTQLDRASGYITSVGGTVKEVLTDSPWGRRRLAYPIRFNSQDFRDGFYAVYHFDLPPAAVPDVERELKLDVRVMRYLVVHDDPKVGERNPGRAEAADAVEAATASTDAGPATGSAVTTPAPAAEPATDADTATTTAPAAEPETAETPVDVAAPAGESDPDAESAPAPSIPEAEPVTEALAEADTEPEAAPVLAEDTEPEAAPVPAEDTELEAAPVPVADATENKSGEENDT